jgi:hypothetical protein
VNPAYTAPSPYTYGQAPVAPGPAPAFTLTLPAFPSLPKLAPPAPKTNGIVQCTTDRNSPNANDCWFALEATRPGIVNGACTYNTFGNSSSTLTTISSYSTCKIETWNYAGDARCIAEDEIKDARNRLSSCNQVKGRHVKISAAMIWGNRGLRLVHS